MSQTEKAELYQALKNAGVTFDKHYREYSTEDLRIAHNRLVEHQRSQPQPATPPPPVEQPPALDPQAAEFFGFKAPAQDEPKPSVPEHLSVPRDPNEMAGQRQNTKENDEPIRVDEDGRVWYQEEVLKPAFPKARGRRVLKYMDPGVKRQVVKSGDYTEEFEVSGDPANAREAEVRITLPSYQVGVYKDPRFPFKVITYNGINGFDLSDVQDFYGGAELIPEDIKRIYVENVLCYDIRTTVRAIVSEDRQQQLTGGRVHQ